MQSQDLVTPAAGKQMACVGHLVPCMNVKTLPLPLLTDTWRWRRKSKCGGNTPGLPSGAYISGCLRLGHSDQTLTYNRVRPGQAAKLAAQLVLSHLTPELWHHHDCLLLTSQNYLPCLQPNQAECSLVVLFRAVELSPAVYSINFRIITGVFSVAIQVHPWSSSHRSSADNNIQKCSTSQCLNFCGAERCRQTTFPSTFCNPFSQGSAVLSMGVPPGVILAAGGN